MTHPEARISHAVVESAAEVGNQVRAPVASRQRHSERQGEDRDGGESWARTSEGFKNEDIHGLAVIHNDGRLLYATTADGLHLSRDDGATWTMQPIDSPWQYVRSIVPKADGSGTLFMTNGNGPPGSDGRIFRSRDFGATWQQLHRHERRCPAGDRCEACSRAK